MIKLEVRNLSKKYNTKTIIQNINFELYEGDILNIYGRNASGKTTLCKILAGIIEPNTGEIKLTVDEQEIYNHYPKYISLYSQFYNLYNELSLIENIQLIAKLKCFNYNVKEISEIINLMELKKFSSMKYEQLSSGFKNRFKIACSLAVDPSILILDEPYNNLDEQGIKLIKRIISNQLEKNKIIITTFPNIEHFNSMSNLYECKTIRLS